MTQPLGQSSQSQDTFNEQIRQVASEKNVLLIDLDKELPSDRQALFLSDRIHLNNDGSIAVAKVIARELAKPLGSNVTAEDYNVSNTAKLRTLSNNVYPHQIQGVLSSRDRGTYFLTVSGGIRPFPWTEKSFFFKLTKEGMKGYISTTLRHRAIRTCQMRVPSIWIDIPS